MLRDRLTSFKYAWQGIRTLFSTQPNARIHLLFAGGVIMAGVFFDLSRQEWCLLVLAMALVLGAEAFNSSVEAVVDLVSPEHHALAGRAKDLAAGAVLLCAIGAAAIGLLIFLPRVLDWWQS
ncbi:MAG: diacylglycerol kinase family protein [Saprospiraceae bacterium]|nr:diacylglycerol kinase family protein [Saprospiraceae bacterium]MCB0625099.1 diacylglycerol kinase family protein [Saprospiraceae bacterium]MCB0682187.1 diacylglycerol kinase family protein [Saprospiraceae bacterium]